MPNVAPTPQAPATVPAYQVDLSTDWQAVDNLTPIVYTSKRNTGSESAPIDAANRRQLTGKEVAASNASYVSAQIVWNIPVALFPSVIDRPKEGDTITDGNSPDIRNNPAVWTVMNIALSAEKSWWDLTCINLAIAYDLADVITIERADIQLSPTGAPTKLFPPTGGKNLYASLLSRVQPQQTDEREERGYRGQATKYTIFLSQQIPNVNTEDRVLWNRVLPGIGTAPPTIIPTYIERLTYHQPEQAFQLPALEGEVVP